MGLFDTIGSLIGTSWTNQANKQMTKDTNAANLALWREQSAYNAPEAQMQRLQAAGLNPNLAYGQIAESRAATPPAMVAPHVEAPRTSLDESISQYQQVKNLQTMNALNNIQIETEKARAIKAAADAEYSTYETKSLKQSGALKTDYGLVKGVVRGVSALGDYVGGVVKKMDEYNKARYERMYLLKYGGPSERAHGSLELPMVTPDTQDGGQ